MPEARLHATKIQIRSAVDLKRRWLKIFLPQTHMAAPELPGTVVELFFIFMFCLKKKKMMVTKVMLRKGRMNE